MVYQCIGNEHWIGSKEIVYCQNYHLPMLWKWWSEWLSPCISTLFLYFYLHNTYTNTLPYQALVKYYSQFQSQYQISIPHKTTGKFHTQTGYQTLLQLFAIDVTAYTGGQIWSTDLWLCDFLVCDIVAGVARIQEPLTLRLTQIDVKEFIPSMNG